MLQSKPLPQTPTIKPPFFSPFSAIRDNKSPDFSSGPENQSSPENADNEDTPEPAFKRGQLSDLSNVTIERGHKPPSKRLSFSEMFSFKRYSPGRTKPRKRTERDVLAKKVHKRKRRELERDDRLTLRRGSDESGSEEPTNDTKTKEPHQAFIPGLIRLLVEHPTLPHVLGWYLQLAWNVFLCGFFMYIIYSFWATIRQDVDMKVQESATATLEDMAACAREYVQNRCDAQHRVPAMESLCNNWESCMNRDPHKVARAKISAHTFAEIFNSFIEPISYKAMVYFSFPLPKSGCATIRAVIIRICLVCLLFPRLRLFLHLQYGVYGR